MAQELQPFYFDDDVQQYFEVNILAADPIPLLQTQLLQVLQEESRIKLITYLRCLEQKNLSQDAMTQIFVPQDKKKIVYLLVAALNGLVELLNSFDKLEQQNFKRVCVQALEIAKYVVYFDNNKVILDLPLTKFQLAARNLSSRLNAFDHISVDLDKEVQNLLAPNQLKNSQSFSRQTLSSNIQGGQDSDDEQESTTFIGSGIFYSKSCKEKRIKFQYADFLFNNETSDEEIENTDDEENGLMEI